MGPPFKRLKVDYKNSVKEIVKTLKKGYGPTKIILFGSCLSGKITPNSDIDMLIVKDTKKSYGQRWLEVGRLVRHIKKDMPFEPWILTPAEFRSEFGRNPFLQEIIEKGKVMYEKN